MKTSNDVLDYTKTEEKQPAPSKTLLLKAPEKKTTQISAALPCVTFFF